MSARILFLAPQPFFQERGTPIAVRMALEALVPEKPNAANDPVESITLVAYPEGEDIAIPGVHIDRVWAPKWMHGVGPGVSWRKLGCDVLMSFKIFGLLWKNRRRQFTLIHAIEESVFIAAVAKILFGVPYIYDMDSSLSLQLTEQWCVLRPLRPAFEFLEGIVIRNAVAVAPVCDSLREIADKRGSRSTVMLRDVSLLARDPDEPSTETIRKEMGVVGSGLVITYIGNLESYQGVSLLVQSFAKIAAKYPDCVLAIVGGRESHQDELKALARSLTIENRVTFLGPRPVKFLRAYLAASDILAAPRTRGNNTPMKIYSYLHSGRPMIATRLPTHTQVLDETISLLVEPTPQSFSEGLSTLLDSAELRSTLGQKAAETAELHFTPAAFRAQLRLLYRDILGPEFEGSSDSSSIDCGAKPRTSEETV